MGAALIQSGMWLFALLLASPMFLFKSLVHYDMNLQSLGIDSVVYCIEDWPILHGRAYYSAFSLFVQYLLPILIVSAAYLRIYLKLRNRIPISVSDTITDRNIERERRLKKTNCLLISIAVIFGISWLPLNIINLFADIYLSKNPTTQQFLVAYAVCHMMGMSSACSNPLLYGWLNDNFRKEFKEILCRDRNTSTVTSNGRSILLKRQDADVAQVGKSPSTKYKGMLDSMVTDNGLSTELTVLTR